MHFPMPYTELSVRTILTLSCAVLPLYCTAWLVYTRIFHPLSRIPGPFWASVTRAWLVIYTMQGNFDEIERDLHQKYGPVVRIAPDEVVSASPRDLKTLYGIHHPLDKTDFYPVWASGRKTFSKHLDLFAETSDKKHAQRRRIVNHIYTLSNILQFEGLVDECSELLATRLGQLADTGDAVDIGEWFTWYTFDVIGQLFFGRMFGFLNKSEDHNSWVQALDMLTPYIVAVAVSPAWSRPFIAMSALFSERARNGLKSMDTIMHATRSSVAQRQTTPAVAADGSPRRDLLQQMLDLWRDKGEKVDFGIGDIQVDSHVAIFAGPETTAIVMRSVVYYLAKHPHIYRQVQAEIDHATACGHLGATVRYAEAIKLPLLCATIKEAMRLHASAGFSLPRIAPTGGIELANAYHIPAGYRVGINPAVIQYDGSIFGADAAQFRPARWLEGNAAEMDRHMLLFGAGTRTCIGKHIALTEVHKLMPHLLRDFDLELVDPLRPWRTNNMFIHKQTGVVVRLRRRSRAVSNQGSRDT